MKRKRPLGKSRAEILDLTEPISRIFGLDRGKAIDRYYIEQFLSRHQADIRGSVLEVENNSYTVQFGGNRVQESHVLHFTAGNPEATIVADLADAHNIPDARFDCIILTQTLQFIYDLQAAASHLHRILRPDGVLLATVPGISQISQYDMERWGDYWRFTSSSVNRLFEKSFGKENIEVRSPGNALVASAFLHGLAVEELRKEELDFEDADYQMLITLRGIRR